MAGIRVLVVRPGQVPAAEDLPDGSLETLYRVLGCETIDVVNVGGGYQAIVDDEGLLNDAPPAGCGFAGAFLFCKHDGEGDLAGLSDDDLGYLSAFWRANRDVPPGEAGGPSAEMFDSFDGLLAALAADDAARERHFRESVERGATADD